MIKEVPAYLCSHVFDKERPVLLVYYSGGDWQFLCGGTHPEQEIPKVVGLNHVLSDDPSLNEVMNLPSEWEAERSVVGSKWDRRPIG